MKDLTTILYVDEAAAFGGSIVIIGYLAEAIDKARFRAVVAGEMDASILEHIIQDNAELYLVPHNYNYVLWGKTIDIINRLPSKLLRKLLIYTMSMVRSLVNVIYILRLAVIILKEKVDIVHVNNGMTNVEIIIAAMLTSCKYVVHLHQIKKPGSLQRLLIKTVPRFIVISEYIKKGMMAHHVPGDRMVVIPNPVRAKSVVSEQSIHVRKRYGINNDELVFGIVGRIVRWKGHIEFLNAAKIVLNAVPESKALIVGDFSDGDITYQETIARIVEENGLKERIIFTGYVKDVEKFYSIMDVFVHASVSPEPFGLVITEAMAYGVPVVASDRGAPNEIITDGVDGFLVDPADAEKLAGTIVSLLKDKALRHRIGEKGKERTLSDYQVGAYATAVCNVYQDVLRMSAVQK